MVSAVHKANVGLTGLESKLMYQGCIPFWPWGRTLFQAPLDYWTHKSNSLCSGTEVSVVLLTVGGKVVFSSQRPCIGLFGGHVHLRISNDASNLPLPTTSLPWASAASGIPFSLLKTLCYHNGSTHSDDPWLSPCFRDFYLDDMFQVPFAMLSNLLIQRLWVLHVGIFGGHLLGHCWWWMTFLLCARTTHIFSRIQQQRIETKMTKFRDRPPDLRKN